MIERVVGGEDARIVIVGKEVKKEEGKEDGVSLRERTERFLKKEGGVVRKRK